MKQEESVGYEPTLRDALAVISILVETIDNLCTKIDGLEQAILDLQQNVTASRTAA